jgi:hypothetical protein
MTYATMIVSLALDGASETRLEIAGQSAERFDAGVIGITAAQFSPPLHFIAGALLDQRQAAIRKRITAACPFRAVDLMQLNVMPSQSV